MSVRLKVLKTWTLSSRLHFISEEKGPWERGANCFQHLGYLNTLKNPDLKHFSLQPLLHSDCMRLSQPCLCSLASHPPLCVCCEVLQPSPAWFWSVDGIRLARGTLEGNAGCRWTLYCRRAAPREASSSQLEPCTMKPLCRIIQSIAASCHINWHRSNMHVQCHTWDKHIKDLSYVPKWPCRPLGHFCILELQES